MARNYPPACELRFWHGLQKPVAMDTQLKGSSQVFLDALSLADRYARSVYPVLLTGETGAGKELFARRIHANSPRARQTWLPVNCGALPPGIFEGELFGYERGAFSGAVQTSRGLVRSADRGTLFFDEVGDLDPTVQVKLLRLLDAGEVRAVGSSRVEIVDVRIVAATNVNLVRAVAEKRFRQDLYERLSVLTLEIPPLRERGEDVRLIAEACLRESGVAYDPRALAPLAEYSWPGNVRQLKNVLIRASVRCSKMVDAALVRTILAEESGRVALTESGLNGSLDSLERKIIEDRLNRWQGNRKRAAEDLGIAKSTLHDKLRKWRMDADRGPGPDFNHA